MSEKKYWQNELTSKAIYGVSFEIRTEFAWRLVHHFGLIASMEDGEDRVGRAKLKLLEPQQVVERAFALSDAFFDMAEARGGMREETVTDEQRTEYSAKLERHRRDLVWKKLKEETGIPDSV